MRQPTRKNGTWPVPDIDPKLCNGCGKCMQLCPTGALELKDGIAIVARPQACQYHGFCEMVCPTGAIQRRFEIVSESEDPTHETSGGPQGGKQA